MPQASLAFLSTGLWRATNPPSQKHRCFPNREGRQKEMKCLAQHHTGNLRPSPAPSSALRSNHSRAPLPADQGKRKKKKTETRISTHSQMTTLNTLGATQVLLPTVSPMAQSWLNIKYQLPGMSTQLFLPSCPSALHLEPLVLMPNHKTTASPWCIYHVWLRDPYRDIHCS